MPCSLPHNIPAFLRIVSWCQLLPSFSAAPSPSSSVVSQPVPRQHPSLPFLLLAGERQCLQGSCIIKAVKNVHKNVPAGPADLLLDLGGPEREGRGGAGSVHWWTTAAARRLQGSKSQTGVRCAAKSRYLFMSEATGVI